MLSMHTGHRLVWWSAVGLGVLIATRLLLNPWALSYGDTSGLPIFNWTLYTWGIPALTLLASARWLRPGAAAQPGGRWVPPVLLSLAILVDFALVDVQVSHIFQDEGPVELGGQGLLQGMVRSLAWAGYGVFVLVAGLLRRTIRLYYYAGSERTPAKTSLLQPAETFAAGGAEEHGALCLLHHTSGRHYDLVCESARKAAPSGKPAACRSLVMAEDGAGEERPRLSRIVR